jgi:hypothetical protein
MNELMWKIKGNGINYAWLHLTIIEDGKICFKNFYEKRKLLLQLMTDNKKTALMSLKSNNKVIKYISKKIINSDLIKQIDI